MLHGKEFLELRLSHERIDARLDERERDRQAARARANGGSANGRRKPGARALAAWMAAAAAALRPFRTRRAGAVRSLRLR